MSGLTLDEAIKHCEEVAEEQEHKAQSIGRQLVGSAIANYQNDCFECAADHRQLAEWLKDYKELKNSVGAVKLSNMKEALELIRTLKAELNEWKENPFWQIKTECRKNNYCNNCAFINHCPFANGNRVTAEYPMDWLAY